MTKEKLINTYRYNTCILPSSTKKLLLSTRIINGMSLNMAISYLKVLNKRFGMILARNLKSILDNIVIVRGLSSDKINQLYLKRIIIQKKKKFYGLRFHAKGRGFRSIKHMCNLNIIIALNNDDVSSENSDDKNITSNNIDNKDIKV